MKRKNSLLITLLIIFSLPFFLIACSKNKVIVEINSSKLTLEDFLYEIYLIEQDRNIWNSKYEESLGIDYWDYEFEDMGMEQPSMEQLSKDTIMTRVILYEILSNQAEKKGQYLNKEDFGEIEEKIDTLIASMSETEFKETGLSKDILFSTFSKLALGNKYYQAVIDDYETNEEYIQSTIDPNEYREYITECLYVPTVEVRDQKLLPYSEANLNKAYNKILDVRKLILNNATFDDVLGHIEGVTHYERSFILDDNTAEEEYKEIALTLNNGDYSDIVTTEFGHYIIHMLDNNSTVRYEKAVENAIMNDKTSQFKIAYDDLLEEYDIKINKEYWASIELGSLTSSESN